VADREPNLLHETVFEFLLAVNFVVALVWLGEYKITSKADLQRETYNDVTVRLNRGTVNMNGEYAPDKDGRTGVRAKATPPTKRTAKPWASWVG